MILLEISRLFTEHGSLLGEHRWKEILKNPDSLEKNSVTKVFHSFYAKGRDAQKDGAYFVRFRLVRKKKSSTSARLEGNQRYATMVS